MSISFDSAITVNIGKYLLDPQDDSENREINPEKVEDNLLEEELEDNLIIAQIYLEKKAQEEQQSLIDRKKNQQKEILDLFRNSKEEGKEDDSPRVIHSDSLILHPTQPESESKESEPEQVDQNEFVFHLNEEDQAVINRYLADTVYHAVERALVFYVNARNDVDIRQKIYTRSRQGFLAGLVGVPTTIKIVSAVANFVAPESVLAVRVAKVASSALYMAYSAVGGAFFGSVVSPALSVGVMPIKNDLKYQEWRAKQIGNEVFERYKLVLRTHPELKDFVYPLTGDLIAFPVKDANGKYHERAVIDAYINLISDKCATKTEEEEREILDRMCPYETGLHLESPEELFPAPDYYVHLIRKIDSLRERGFPGLPPEVIEGLNNAQEGAQKNVEHIFRGTKQSIISLLNKKGLKGEEVEETLREVKNNFFGRNKDAY